MKQTTHQVWCQSLLNHGNFSAGLCIKKGSSRAISPAFLQQFLAIEFFHNFAFLRTGGEGTSSPPCSKLLAQYVCPRSVTDTLPPCFKHVCQCFFLITYQIHLDETKLMTLFHIFGTFLMNFGSWFNKLPGEKCIYLINAGPRINAGSTRLIFK